MYMVASTTAVWHHISAMQDHDVSSTDIYWTDDLSGLHACMFSQSVRRGRKT